MEEGSRGGIGGDQQEAVWQLGAEVIKSGRFGWAGGGGSTEGPRLSGCERAALRSAVAGGQWPQTRLALAGLADHPNCALCLHNGKEVAGTLTHKHF